MVLSLLFLLCSCAHSPRPWTKEEKLLLIASLFAVSADIYTTEKGLDTGNVYEQNPYIGKYPTDTQLLIKSGIAYTGILIGAHYLPHLRAKILGFQITVNGVCAIHNNNLDP